MNLFVLTSDRLFASYMKICFVSNFMNHHQQPVADELYRLLGEDFLWVATTPADPERIKLGYDDLNNKFPYILRTYIKEEYEKAYNRCITCDCLIVAYEFGDIIKRRMELNLLTFICTERICKKSILQMLSPYNYMSTLIHFTRFRKKPLYLLSIGEYAAKDFDLSFSFPNKKYRWGYFTDVPQLSNDVHSKWNNEKPLVFWASRFIDWKHPEYIVFAAEQLKEEGILCQFEMAGCGDMFNDIEQMIKKKNLSDYIKLLGPQNHKTIRQKMLASNIFCLTSNRQEGWGAVVGEALASDCIVISSKKTGASSSLIIDGKSGILFKDNCYKDFYLKLREEIINFKKHHHIAIEAYNTMFECWNPETAAERLILLIECLLNNMKSPFTLGPCSKIKK